jgi:general secretion pathway protein F
MPVYRYKALDARGAATGGAIEAANPKDARQRLQGKDLFLLSMEGAGEASAIGPVGRGGRRSGRLSLVTRQFATLVKAGIPLVDALGTLVDTIEDRKLAVAFRDIKENVTQGMTLEDALERHPRYFTPFYISMVRVGEASGNMTLVLTQLSEYLHKRARLRTKVVNAMTYPALMFAMGILVVGFLLTLVTPKITDALLEAGKKLPLPTTMLIATSSFLVKFWWALGLALAAAIMAYRAVVATERGALARDAAVLAIPVLGPLLKKGLVSRFCLTFSTLLRAGLPAVESLSIVRETVGNRLLGETVAEIRDRIIEGQDIGAIMERSGVFPPLVAYMIAVGEKSGRLEEMLGVINEYYDEEVEGATARFTVILEPAMIIVLAMIIGFVVLAVVLPILDMGKLI